MTPEKRNIQVILDKLWIEYSQLYQKVNNLHWHLHLVVDDENEGQYGIKLLQEQHKAMTTYLNILKERIDNLSKEFKECK